MSGLNKIMVIGYLGSDPEMRYTPNGYPVTSFRIATSRRYNTQDGQSRDDTEWFTVTAWRDLAERVNQYLAKGQRAYVEGRLESKPWLGSDGQPRSGNEITANVVIFLDRPGAGEQGSEAYSGTGAGDFEPAEGSTPDDLPF